MRYKLTLLALPACLIAMSAVGAEVYFSPGPDCENHIVAAVDAAKLEVSAAVYSVGNRRIVDALKAAHVRGVQVRLLTDHVQAAGRGSRALELIDAGVTVRLHSKFKIAHDKFAVFDAKTAVNGSFNWTRPATEDNSENCAMFATPADDKAVAAFKTRFEELWRLNTQEKSATHVTKLRARNKDRIPAGQQPPTAKKM